MNSDFADMNAANITWARIDLYPTHSPNPAFDSAIEGAQSHNINVLAAVHKTPPSNDLGTDPDRAAYRTWLAQMVDRYKYYVKYWEIQNEPNLHYEWNIDESSGSDQAQYEASVRRYVSVLQDGFETIKGNDSNATVLFGGLSEWTVERYLDVLVTTEAYRYFDIMPFHPYGSNPDQILSRFNAFETGMSSLPAYAAKPIWVNELGFNTTWPNLPGRVGSEQEKADYLVQSMSRLYIAGAQLPIFWYTLHENENASGFGLTLKDNQTLQTQYYPAFYAYRDLALGPALTSVTITNSAPDSLSTSTCGLTPTPGPTATLTPTAAPTVTPTPTASPTPSGLTPTPTPTATAGASPAPTPTPTPTPTPGAGGGIAFQSTSTTVNTTAVNTLVIAAPSGTTAGDVLVASLALNGGADVQSPPPGWVQIAALTTLSKPKAYAYYHVAGSSESASYTWTLSAAVTNSGAIARYSGVANASPLDAPPNTAASLAVSSLTVPSVTTATSGAMLIGGVAVNSSNASVLITAPAGMSERWDLAGRRQEYDDAVEASAGSSGAKTWTFSTARDATGWLAALRPAP